MNIIIKKLPYDYDIIVLAAGESKRFQNGNKLLSQINQVPILINVIEEVCLTNMSNIFVVTGYEHQKIKKKLKKYDVKIIYNKNYMFGKSSSISLGINNLSKQSQAAMICLADMPLIKSHNYNKLLFTHKINGGIKSITVPRRNGKIGNPIIWGAAYYEELLKIKGDRGGKQILNNYKQNLNYCDIESNSFFMDVDTEDDLLEVEKNK